MHSTRNCGTDSLRAGAHVRVRRRSGQMKGDFNKDVRAQGRGGDTVPGGMWQFVEGSHGTTPQLVARLSQRIDRLPLHVIDCAEIRLELLQLAIDHVVAQFVVESQRTSEN